MDQFQEVNVKNTFHFNTSNAASISVVYQSLTGVDFDPNYLGLFTQKSKNICDQIKALEQKEYLCSLEDTYLKNIYSPEYPLSAFKRIKNFYDENIRLNIHRTDLISALKHLKQDDCSEPVSPKNVLGYFEFLCAEWIANYHSNEIKIKNNNSKERLEDRKGIKQILNYFMSEEDLLEAIDPKTTFSSNIRCNLKKEYSSFYRAKYLPNLSYIANKKATFTQIFKQFNRLFKRIKNTPLSNISEYDTRSQLRKHLQKNLC